MANKNLWNYTVAEKILKQFKDKEEIVFQSGFGPSGYPHIGTFGEIVRPRYVIQALNDLSDKKTKYIVFTDDMDGLRKVPLGMPEMLKEHLGKPVSRIPDPWGCCESFSRHMINQILAFLEEQELTYDIFKYSHKTYQSGEFNPGLKLLLENEEKIKSIILPGMREESRKGWSPFMPVCEKCGRNLTTTATAFFPGSHTLRYSCDRDSEQFSSCGHKSEVSVLDGKVKMGWKIDWALRWFTFGVNFEMYGKDLMESAALSGKILRTVLGGRPPLGYFYEMFLDESGAKISKSVGKGLTVQSWVEKAPKKTLNLFMFKAPQKAKKLSLSVIPRYVDEYIEIVSRYYAKPAEERIENGTYREIFEFLHDTIFEEPFYNYKVSFNLLINLIAAVGTSDVELIKKYVHRYEEEKSGSLPFLELLIEKAGAYVEDVMSKERVPYQPSDLECTCIEEFIAFLREGGHSEEDIQSRIFRISRENDIPPGSFFSTIYKLISGQASGPRLGSFIHLLGEDETAGRLEEMLG